MKQIGMCSFYKAVAQFDGTGQLILTRRNSEVQFSLCIQQNTPKILVRHGKGMKMCKRSILS